MSTDHDFYFASADKKEELKFAYLRSTGEISAKSCDLLKAILDKLENLKPAAEDLDRLEIEKAILLKEHPDIFNKFYTPDGYSLRKKLAEEKKSALLKEAADAAGILPSEQQKINDATLALRALGFDQVKALDSVRVAFAMLGSRAKVQDLVQACIKSR